ncbi:hypothetical protein EDEG_04229, partial [Edhazardia aedis USNM 41457]
MVNKKTTTLKELYAHKKVPNTNYTIDCFYINVVDCTKHFLSHFHGDHYNGLTKKSSANKKIYCSETTANLVIMRLRVLKENIVILNMYKWEKLEKDIFVYLIDANHCPGAVCFIFSVKGVFYLHCGDFRAGEEFYLQFDDYAKFLDINSNCQRNIIGCTGSKSVDNSICEIENASKINDITINEAKDITELRKTENILKIFSKKNSHTPKNQYIQQNKTDKKFFDIHKNNLSKIRGTQTNEQYLKSFDIETHKRST